MLKTEDYLTWFKNLDARLANSRGAHSLISSNVSEPLDMLVGLIRHNGCVLRQLQKYNNDWGHPVLKQRISARNGVKPENILLSNGCTNATYLAVVSNVRAGDTFVCESPAYQLMWQSASFMGARIKWIKRRPPDYVIDPDELARLVDGRTAMVALTSLHNPSGARLGRSQLQQIASAVRRRNKRTRILMDEVFRDFTPDRPACTVDPIYISTSSLSKVYGLSHLECGWVMADEPTIGRIWPCFVMSDGNGSRYLESLSALVFSHLDDFLRRSLDLVVRNRQTLSRAVEPLLHQGLLEGGLPEQGCIWFPKLAGRADAGPFCRYAARRHRVHVVPGSFFGDPSRFRVGFGGDTKLVAKAAKSLAEAIAGFERKR